MDVKKIMPNINRHIREGTKTIDPSENAHTGLIVPAIVFEYGNPKQKMKSIPRLYKYMLGSIREVKKSYRELYNQPQNAKKQISSSDLSDLQEYAKEIGIDQLGFAEIDPSYIFAEKRILYKNAIVLLMKMDPEIIKTAPSKATEEEIFSTYYKLNIAVNKIKDFLNQKGYNAEASPALGGEVNFTLLAQKAGMGYIGKHGLLITPEFGPSLRLAAVFTDIENLPIDERNEHSWIKEFCNTCNKCVRKCPAQAIYKEPKVFPDNTEEHIDYKKCAVPFSNQKGCTICVKECTFFKSDYYKIKKSFMNKK